MHFFSIDFVAGTAEGGTMTLRDRLLAVFVAVLWGVNFLAIDVALEHFPPIFLSGLRMLVIAVPTVLLVPRPRVAVRWLVGYGVGFGLLQFLFLFLGMAAGMPAGLASPVLQASGPFTVLLGALLLGERIGARGRVGIGAAVAGLAAIAVSRAQAAALLPVVLTLLGALGWAFGNLSNRMAMRGRGDGAPGPNPLHLTLWMTTIPPVPLLAASALVEGPGVGWSAVAASTTPDGLPGLAALAYLSLVATVLAAGIWTSLMRRNPAGVVAPHSLLVPVVGMTLAAAVLGERPGAVEIVAGLVIVAGVLLGSSGRLEPAPALPGVSDPAAPTLGRGGAGGQRRLRGPARHRPRPARPHAREGS